MNHEETFTQAHEKAIAELTAEGYLLGELSDAAAEAFEEHYFDCRVCAETVRAGELMFAAGRVAFNPNLVPVPALPPVPVPPSNVLIFRRRVQQSLSLAATAAFAFVLGSTLFQPPAVPLVEVASFGGSITGVMRGSNDDLKVQFDGKHPQEILFDPILRVLPSYRVELRDRSGKVLKALDLSPEQALNENGVSVLLRSLPAGRYVLAIVGEGNPGDLAQRVIVVQ